jgi:hypothetical protein
MNILWITDIDTNIRMCANDTNKYEYDGRNTQKFNKKSISLKKERDAAASI